MDNLENISPAEFRKLQLQVDILQRFLTKTFGSSFLDFCKQAQLSSSKGASKPLPPLNKANGTSHGNEKVEVPSQSRTSPASRRLPPPPLLQRPGGSSSITSVSVQSTKGNVSKANNATVSRVSNGNGTIDTGENEEEYYDEGAEEDMNEYMNIQPEAVFSDDEHGNTSSPVKKSNMSTQQANNRKAVKRAHNMAFEYDETEVLDNGNNMQLPEGTECIVLDSDDVEEQGQNENYVYQQDEELYGDLANNGEEMYDEDGYSYNMVDDGLEMTGNDTGNYQTEDLQTDGNVTFGTVITAQDTGMQYFQCSFCPSAKVFKHKQSLKEHYLLNHSPTPPAFQCQCGRRFLKQSQLKRHEVVHTAERPYVCPICGKDFTRKDNMTVHMVRNHAEKKHKCPVCPDKIYATPAEVNRHLRMYHSQWQP